MMRKKAVESASRPVFPKGERVGSILAGAAVLAILGLPVLSVAERAEAADKITAKMGVSGGSVARENETRESAASTWSGPFAFVEWNVADLLFLTGRLHTEYVVVDGLAFGFSVEYQKRDRKNWEQQTAGFMASTTQYFQSLALRGVFLRGEAGLQAAKFQERDAQEGSTFGMAFGLDVGYRQPFGKHFVLATALGGRRIVPDFFLMHQSSSGSLYERHEGLWQPRVDFSMGVAF